MKRSEFLQSGAIALGAWCLGSTPLRSAGEESAAAVEALPKLGLRVSPYLDHETLAYLQELKVGWCRLDIHEESFSCDQLGYVRERYENYGLKIYSAINYALLRQDLMLGESGRAQALERFGKFVIDLGRQHIPVCDMAWIGLVPGSQGFKTSTEDLRGVRTRVFDLAEYRRAEPSPKTRWSPEMVWDSLVGFLDYLAPIAERSAVKIAIHPDDPPIAEQGGVARVLHKFEHFQKLFQRCRSPAVGMNFCVGTWAEGGRDMGATVAEMIRWLSENGRLLDVHFRNVSGVLPRFQETFLNDGDLDMQELMDLLVEQRFTGLLVPDHVPAFSIEDRRKAPPPREQPYLPLLGLGYTMGCLQTMLKHAAASGREGVNR